MSLFALDLDLASDTARPTIAPANQLELAVKRLSPTHREIIRELSGVPRARHASFASCLGAAAVRGLLQQQAQANLDDLAIIVVGWRHHIPISWGFTERALTYGAGLVNPVQFPHILPSAVSTTIAAVVGSHGPALGVDLEFPAFRGGLDLAKQLIATEICQSAAIVSVSDASVFSEWAQTDSQSWPAHFDGAFALFVDAHCRSSESLNVSANAVDRLLNFYGRLYDGSA